ncbi:ATP-dependent DNA helicase 2 subunit 2 [Marchantia polymorpha subsp. ruderalis]|uniref:ATP-dependent DNA helicase 2 subunit KU80 n=1 Tax=Marchantia polymorpha TaxID=3197 RepID=A0A2R6W8E8_MARPO|nr:hypothetical protein MARPO_0129s0012 [Marchantia polymorpha]BBN01732.1 hypothetical protein Mp_2g09860 [Marchantia polymorpha subsp. ruderalis]|eukprot:PTQ30121.1 hypothetical protein MARPO_0129s0012 [Marchantia polymorpha]
MARNKETLILLVDIGPSMHPHLDYAARAISALVQRKIVHNKHDEVGLVFFGANDTDNELSSELGGYEDIVVLRPIAVVSEELAQAVDQFSKEYGTSDFMDAMVVAMDLIVKKCAAGSKGNKRIYLITDGESPVKEPEEGTKSEQVELLRNQLQMHNIILDAVVIRLKGENGALESKASQENEFLLRSFADGTMGDLVLVESYTTLLGAVKSRSVSPTTLYRGDLELTPNMSIKVWVYKKVSSERMPTLRIYSDKAPLLDTTATHEVKFDIEYKSSVDLDVSIAPEQRIKAYKYGPQYVPISSKEEEALKFRTEKGLKVVGFTDKSNVPRHYFMKETNVFVPELRNTRSTLAISCLARAMEAEGKVAIVRCVWRAGQANVALGVLTPCLGSDDSVADCFYFNNIPFSEDLREFAFASFKDRPSTQQPTRLQQEAADALVQMMDLVPYPGQEFLMPERTVNPVLQRFYSFLHLKSVNPEAAVPPLDKALQIIIQPEERFIQKVDFMLQTFKEQFQLIRSTQTEKGGRKFWKDRLGENEAALPGEDLLQIEDGKPLTFEFLTGKKVEQVGSLNPVEDFEALLARRDSDQWVTKAIKGMKKIITDLLNSAYNGNTYEKAVTCLIALRRGCVIQEEPSDFNTFLEEISNRCRGKRQNDFWELVTAKNLTLISKDETPDSDVTQEEAASFLSRVQNSGHVSEGVPEEEVDEIEALLDDVI